MILFAAAVSGMGLTCALLRKSLVGVMIGLQLMMLGATMIFISADRYLEARLFGLFIALSTVVQLVGGFALAVRLFFLKKRTEMDEIRTLKN